MVGGRAWYDDAFGSLYGVVYAHRSDEQARKEVRFVVKKTGIKASQQVLDLACGNGRHLRAFAGCSIKAVGVDRSRTLLAEARGEGCRELVQGDMRQLPFASERFILVASFFTSFGYFRTMDEDRSAMREAVRVLAPGGWYFLDFLRAEQVKEGMVPHSERDVGDLRVVEDRRIDGGRVLKRVRVFGNPPDPLLDYEESVRLYGKDDLARLAGEAGLVVQSWFGSFDDDAGEDGPRRCLLARRPS